MENEGQAADPPRRPLAPEDLYRFSWVSDPQLAPDGQRVAYVVTRPEEKGRKYKAEIWLAPVTAGELPAARRYTAGPRDRAPRWSPDGTTIAFVSDRGDGAQVWLIPFCGGEARQLTKLKGGVTGEPVWSPDGKEIAIGHRRAIDDQPAGSAADDSVDDPADGDKAADDRPAAESDVKTYTRLRYKENGRGLWDGKYAHIYVVPVAGGEPRQLTFGPYDDQAPAWSPDGRQIAFAANRAADPDRTPVSDIWVVPAAGGEPRQLTASLGPAGSPAWSPDGRWVAYYGHAREFFSATQAHIYVVSATEPLPPRDVLTGWDGGVGVAAGSDMMTSSLPRPAWTPDGEAVLFLASSRGAVNIYRAAVSAPDTNLSAPDAPAPASAAASAVRQLTHGNHAIYAASFDPGGGAAAVARATPANPGDLWFYADLGTPPARPPARPVNADAGAPPVDAPPIGDRADRLTEVNPWLANRHLVAPAEFVTTGPDGDTVHGWLMKPCGFAAGEKYPLVVEIHGGPHTAYGWAFSHEFQVLCGRGFGVMYSNPAGSTGYGQAFAALTRHDWGGRDYRDVMAATDHAAAQEWVDTGRLGVTGGSYGGYLTNWLIGHTDRFGAAVTQRSTCNRYSQFGTSDTGYYIGQFEFKGNPWDEAEFYLARSPITYVNQVSTPLLLIHSENDLRCQIEQAEQFYTALRWLGKTAELVRFPDENHELSRSGQPIHRVERLQRIADWFSRYLG